MSYAEFKPHMLERGIPEAVLAGWLEGFHDTEASGRAEEDKGATTTSCGASRSSHAQIEDD